MSTPNLYTQLYVRFTKFYLSCLKSSNPIITYVANLSKNNFTNVSFNIRSVLSFLYICNVNSNDLCLIEKLRKVCEDKFSSLDVEEVPIALAIKELLEVRDNVFNFTPVFSSRDLNIFIYSLCVDT